MGNRSTEFTLGLIGGITGFIGALIAMAVGGLGSAFGAEGASSIAGLGVSALIFSILGIVGASIVKNKDRLGGIFMIVSALGGIISISFFYSLSFILLAIGGIKGVIRKKNGR